MRRTFALVGLLALMPLTLAAPALPAQETKAAAATPTPQPTDKLLKDAYKTAKAKKKNVMVLFGASWCIWCKRLHGVMEQPEFAKTLSDNYVIVHLDVMENGDKTALENPGGNDLMKTLGGEKSGLPFYAFLDATGKKIADSNVMPNDQNIGYPGSPEEIAAFATLLKTTAPKMAPAKRDSLIAYLKANAPKQ